MAIKRVEYWFVALSLLVLLCATVCGSGHRLRTTMSPLVNLFSGERSWSEHFTPMPETTPEQQPPPPADSTVPKPEAGKLAPIAQHIPEPFVSTQSFHKKCPSCANTKSDPLAVNRDECRLCVSGLQQHIRTRGKNAITAPPQA